MGKTTALYEAVIGHNSTKRIDVDIRNNYVKIIKLLLDNNVSVNIKPHVAAQHIIYDVLLMENYNIFKLFVEDGVTRDNSLLEKILKYLKSEYDYPEGKEYLKMLILLLKDGVKPTHLLHHAVNLKVAKLLIDYGDEPTKYYKNKKFESPEVEEYISNKIQKKGRVYKKLFGKSPPKRNKE